jgi:uncharacterized membrane protein YeiH
MANESLTVSILILMYFGDVVFAISGALMAAKYKMDIVGFIMIGTITGIGGGTTRDLLLGRTVWWTQDPIELILVVSVSIITFFFITNEITRKKGAIWADALGLSVFSVVGAHIALTFGSPFYIAVVIGIITATGGGVIRDMITNNLPMIMSGQLYATAALLGAFSYVSLKYLGAGEVMSEIVGVLAAFSLRASAIIFDIRMGPPGEFIRIGKTDKDSNDH